MCPINYPCGAEFSKRFAAAGAGVVPTVGCALRPVGQRGAEGGGLQVVGGGVQRADAKSKGIVTGLNPASQCYSRGT